MPDPIPVQLSELSSRQHPTDYAREVSQAIVWGSGEYGGAVVRGWGFGGWYVPLGKLTRFSAAGVSGVACTPTWKTDYLGLREAKRACERSFERPGEPCGAPAISWGPRRRAWPYGGRVGKMGGLGGWLLAPRK